MGKKFYIGFTILFFLCVISFGVFVYNNNTKILAEEARFAQFEWVIPLSDQYDSFDSYSLDSPYFMGTRDDGGEVLLDQKGQVIERGDNLFFANEHAYSYAKGDAVGLKDYKGNIIVSAQFEYIDSYDGQYGVGRAFDGTWQVFNHKGDILMTGAYTDQIRGRYFVKDNGVAYVIYDMETNREIKTVDENSEITYLGKGYYQETEGIVDVSENTSKVVYLDKNFKEVDANKAIRAQRRNRIVYEDSKYRYTDKQGKVVFEIPFEEPSDEEILRYANFYNGLAIIGYYGKMGAIDKKGQWVLPPEYYLRLLSRNLIAVYRGNQCGVMKVSEDNDDD